jgi:hypothetical protein
MKRINCKRKNLKMLNQLSQYLIKIDQETLTKVEVEVQVLDQMVLKLLIFQNKHICLKLRL